MSEFVRSTRCRRWITLMTLIAAMFGFAGHVFADASTNHVIAKKAPPWSATRSPHLPRNRIREDLQVAAPPSNDTCAAPLVLNLNRVTKVSTVDATDDYQTLADPACYSGIGQSPTTAPGRDVVLSFTAPANGSYTFKMVHQDPADANSLGDNRVLYVSAVCPGSGVVPCIKGANRNMSRAAAILVTGLAQQPVRAGELRSDARGPDVLRVPRQRPQRRQPRRHRERRRSSECLTETEPNDSIATANAMACGIEGSIHRRSHRALPPRLPGRLRPQRYLERRRGLHAQPRRSLRPSFSRTRGAPSRTTPARGIRRRASTRVLWVKVTAISWRELGLRSALHRRS